MVFNLMTLGAIIFFTSIAVIGLTWLILKNKTDDLPQDSSLITHFINPLNYTDGFSEGVIVDSFQGTERTTFRFRPKDIDFVAIFNKTARDKVKEQIITVRNDLMIPLPKGTGPSKGRNKIICLPERVDSLPTALRNSPLGALYEKFILDKNVDWNYNRMLQNANDRQVGMIHTFAGKELSTNEMKRIQATYSDALKIISAIKPENKPTPINTNLPNFGGNR